MASIEGAIDIKTIGDDTYSVMLDVASGGWGSAKTIVGIQNVDVVLKALGVPTGRTDYAFPSGHQQADIVLAVTTAGECSIVSSRRLNASRRCTAWGCCLALQDFNIA
jgi:hypothetical protein